MLKACIFDLDGTLCNTLESMAVVANGVLSEFGLKTLPTDNFRFYAGDGASVMIERCLKDAGDPELLHYEKAEKLYRERFNEDPLRGIKVYPGMEGTLRALKDKGVKIGVCSNKPGQAAEKVISTFFGDLFDGVIGQKADIRRKPAPDMPLMLARQFGVQPEECLYIGDSCTDMQTGQAAGMTTVGAVWGFRGRKELEESGADHLAEKPEDILQIFEGKIRVVFSDLDGTILRDGAQEVPEGLFPLIRGLREKGILFAAASGRQYANMRRMLEPVADDIIFVCENGAMAVWKDEILYQEAFPTDLCRDIYRAAMEKDRTEFLYSGPAHHFIFPKAQEIVTMMRDVVKNDFLCADSLDDVNEVCVKSAVFEPGGASDENLKYWQDRFGDRCEVATSGNQWIDFIPFGINKGLGVQRICEHFEAAPAMCMAFGDELNDVDMLLRVGYGVAMRHARSRVRDRVEYEAETVEEVLERLISSEGYLSKEVLSCIQKKR